MKLYRDEAIVLRTHDLGEADRIITFFSRRHGKMRAAAKGVRRTKSRFGARLEPFSMVDLQLYEGRTLDVVTEAATLNPYGRSISRDYDGYTCACVIAEVADKLAAIEGEPDQPHYLLLHGAIHALATGAHRPGLVVDSYILRAMALHGWALSLYECAVCAAKENLAAFHLRSGGVVCSNCAPRSATYPDPQTIDLLGSLVSGRWDAADGAAEHERRAASGIVAAYLQWHIERKVRSLRIAESA